MQPGTQKPKHFNTVGMEKLIQYQNTLDEEYFKKLFHKDKEELIDHITEKFFHEHKSNFLKFFAYLDPDHKEIVAWDLQSKNILIK